MSAGRLAALGLVAAAASGCTSPWYAGYEHRDIARTDIVVRTEPPGATVYFNDAKAQEPAPIRIPVEYEHDETMYERQTNYGLTMREDMSPLVTVLTFPIWGIASLFHYRETLRRHEYVGNVHVVAAQLEGFEDAEETITLDGEAERQVRLKLVKSK